MKRGRPALEALEPRWLLAAAGELDPTFAGGDGRALLAAPGMIVGAQEALGHFIGILYTRELGDGTFRLGRLQPDGSADPNFDPTVVDQNPPTPGRGQRHFAVHRGNGRIAMVSAFIDPETSAIDSRLVLLDANGNPVNPNASSRLADLGVDADFFAHRVAWQGDNLIVLGGRRANIGSDDEHFGELRLLRFFGNGQLDSTFSGGGGAAEVHSEWISDAELAVGPQGQITVAINRRSFDMDFLSADSQEVYRYTPDGARDLTFGNFGFGGTGVVELDGARDNSGMRLLALHVGDDGSTYHMASSFESGVAYRRLAPDGSLLAEVTHLGLAFPSGDIRPMQLALQPDGKLLAIGTGPGETITDPQSGYQTIETGWSIVRLYPDGQVDTRYGAGGVARPHFGFSGPAAVQPDGKVIIAGDRYGPDRYEIGRLDTGPLDAPVIRLNGRGTLLVYGTAQPENLSVHIRARDGKFIARVGDLAVGFAPSRIKRIAIFAGRGHDTVTIGTGVVKGAYAQGDDGDDTLNGGPGDDVLVGGLGNDFLRGYDGHDKLAGEADNDYLLGGAGKDDLFGAGGRDTLHGAGGMDRLFGGFGIDGCNGGNGDDAAAQSEEDQFDAIERFLEA